MIKFLKTTTTLSLTTLAILGVTLWAQQPDETRRQPRPRFRPEPVARSQPKAPAKRQDGPAHVVEPPDLLLVEVLEALPGRPISGERLVRPDGTVSLGFYGDVHVAGLTLPEIKEKIIRHLRRFINDQTLGLVETDENGEPKIDPQTEKPILIKDLKRTDRVFVDVTAYNSEFYYIQGEVVFPGRVNFTGNETILDVLTFVGGLLPSADRSKIRLIRSFPKGSPVEVLPIDYEEITMGTDSSTNYQLLPGDRLVVPRDPSYTPPGSASDRSRTGVRSPSGPGPRPYFAEVSSGDPQERQVESLRALERHLSEVEKKLDRIIDKIERGEKAERKPARGPAQRVGPDSQD
jgi:polysaccharide export outer membrane protein